ncbi:wall-associated receptor kinase 5-like [Coffea eugenioides]|uniref:wall-associated receptor kinase 5-like n=1 Tax=Coffea eugenioides TaxID=49369 RepID=UPI000F604D42|nr:wall-associated receptor kinase 5-like [Coffea eugenioides]
MNPLFLPAHISALITLLFFHVQGSKLGSSAKPGCQQKCGNLTIPYPFGIGKGCCFAEEFEVACNDSRIANLPYFEGTVVYQISEDSFGIMGQALSFTYNRSSGKNLQNEAPGEDFLGPHFSFSHTRNKFVAIGCDIFAYLTDAKTNEFVTGCAALGNSSDISPSASSSPCSGVGCCQASLPKDLTDSKSFLHTINTRAMSWSSNSSRCGFLILAAKEFSDFGKFNMSKCDETYQVPIVLDWSIGNLSCQEAKKRTDYACHDNSYCVNSTRGVGYQCRCSPGYEGNPYLPNGCEDVDECETQESNNCPMEALCLNTPGGYLCTCFPGYKSDRKHIGKLVCVPERRNRIIVLSIELGIGLTFSLLMIILIATLLYHKLRKKKDEIRKKNFFRRNGGLLLKQQMSSSRGSISETKIFTKEELYKATNNFSENRVLGKGGLGTVYKGMLLDGSIVAVKKSNKVNEDQIVQFINEVSILSQVNHRHIVKLLGCCLETEVPLLVYEYVSNGTLSNHLHDESNVRTISWENRLRIAGESAGALAYMHSHASTAIFHRDIKSSNILLDENFRAVISDFGLSRSVPTDKSHLTTLVGGTFGYLDPEYLMTGQLNDRSDVYAFGVVLAELLTGQKAVSSDKENEGLVIQFQSSMNEGRLFNILDGTVSTEGQHEEITVVAMLAKKCMELNSRNRPTMKEVAVELDKLMMARKSLVDEKTVHEDDGCLVGQSSYCCKTDIIPEGNEEYLYSF